MTGFMRQPGRAGYITNRINARLGRCPKPIGHNMPPINFNSGAVQSQIFNIADDANRQNHALGLQIRMITIKFCQHAIATDCDRLQFHICQDVHAPLFKRLGHKCRYVAVFDRQNTI